MNNIPVIAFAAYSGTGKTTLIEKLVGELKNRGLRLAVIKHDGHKFEIDHEGKDSWRFAKAGADITMISSDEQTAYVEKRKLSLESLLRMVYDVDLILVEGYKNKNLPQIGIARAATEKGFPFEPEHFIALVTDMEMDTDIPCFGLEDIALIADFILERTAVKNTNDFTHFNEEGRAKMVDVGEKPESHRTAIAAARVLVNKNTFDLIRSGGMRKGDVLTVAQIAGVMGAKRTPDLIPMCHPILIDGIDLSLRLDEVRCSVEIEAIVSCDGRTGVEMEALTAVSTAALTVYDMCKAVQKDMIISDIRLLQKTGGVHGDFQKEEII
ncbi:MAG: cyclic pyranopterin monophosphate synthase MoaC [Oscillospiraceae bacterium]|nr:cyclic pyranopterin monophosphate synthase MoaC [Oscillospiraceae bacterium]